MKLLVITRPCKLKNRLFINLLGNYYKLVILTFRINHFWNYYPLFFFNFSENLLWIILENSWSCEKVLLVIYDLIYVLFFEISNRKVNFVERHLCSQGPFCDRLGWGRSARDCESVITRLLFMFQTKRFWIFKGLDFLDGLFRGFLLDYRILANLDWFLVWWNIWLLFCRLLFRLLNRLILLRLFYTLHWLLGHDPLFLLLGHCDALSDFTRLWHTARLRHWARLHDRALIHLVLLWIMRLALIILVQVNWPWFDTCSIPMHFHD